MGMTTKSVPFFDDKLAIRPTEATSGKFLDRKVSMRKFAEGKMLSLEEIVGTDEFIATRDDGEFIRGPIA